MDAFLIFGAGVGLLVYGLMERAKTTPSPDGLTELPDRLARDRGNFAAGLGGLVLVLFFLFIAN
jgi:hypothetical protein